MRKYCASPCCGIHKSCKGSCVPSSGLPPFPFHIDLLPSLLYGTVETTQIWFPFSTENPPSPLSILSTMVGISAESAEPMCGVSHYTMGACSLLPCDCMAIHADKTKSPEIKALSTRCSTGFSPKIRSLRCSHHPGSAKF